MSGHDGRCCCEIVLVCSLILDCFISSLAVGSGTRHCKFDFVNLLWLQWWHFHHTHQQWCIRVGDAILNNVRSRFVVIFFYVVCRIRVDALQMLLKDESGWRVLQPAVVRAWELKVSPQCGMTISRNVRLECIVDGQLKEDIGGTYLLLDGKSSIFVVQTLQLKHSCADEQFLDEHLRPACKVSIMDGVLIDKADYPQGDLCFN